MTFKEFRDLINSVISNDSDLDTPVKYEDDTGGAYCLNLRLSIPRIKKGHLSIGIAYSTKIDLTVKDVLNILSEFEHAVSSLNPDRNNIEGWEITKMSYPSTTKIKVVTNKNNEKYFVIY